MGLIVIDPGLSTTVQDAGRAGYREWGVPPGGAFDRGAAGLANALVGNDADRPVLELTLIGGVYLADVPLALAMAGAPMEAKVVAPDGDECLLTIPLSWSLRGGSTWSWAGRPKGRGRTWRSGGDGDRGFAWVAGRRKNASAPATCCPPSRDRSRRVIPPARPRYHPPPSRSASSTVPMPFERIQSPIRRPSGPIGGSASGRGATGWACDWKGSRWRSSCRPIVSRRRCAGAVQVAGGQLIVLGVACGTMGGYPHVAHVISADLDRLGQLRPGDAIAFHRVTLDAARRADHETRLARQALFNRVATAAQDS